MNGPLKGIRVLDLSQFLSGPRAGQILSMLGAETVKVESPQGDTMRLLLGMTGSHRAMHVMHQGKKGVVINLRDPEGAALLRRMVKKTDVLIENFAPGIMKKLSLDYDKLKEINSKLIYASISGFGMTGPLSDRTAFDLISQATGGAMYANHQEDRPPGVFFGDLCSGAYSAIGIMAALRERDQTGAGKLVDVSMQDVIYFHNFWAMTDRATLPDKDKIEGILGADMQNVLSDADNPMPFWNSFKAKDGYVVIVALTDKQWRALTLVIEKPEMADDERFSTFVARILNASEGIGAINDWTARRRVSEIIDKLAAARIPCGAVNDYEVLHVDPQLKARDMLADAPHPKWEQLALPGFPVRFGGEEKRKIEAGPEMGEHTDEVLNEWLGLRDDEIQALRKKGVVM